MGRRNWCSVEYIDSTGELRFDIRVEIEKGIGRTKGCVVRYFNTSLIYNFLVQLLDILSSTALVTKLLIRNVFIYMLINERV